VKVDGRFEVLGVAEAAGGLLDPLDDSVDALKPGVGEVMAQVAQQVRQVALNPLKITSTLVSSSSPGDTRFTSGTSRNSEPT